MVTIHDKLKQRLEKVQSMTSGEYLSLQDRAKDLSQFAHSLSEPVVKEVYNDEDSLK